VISQYCSNGPDYFVNTILVYFIYPETCGVRLEDMDSLFGDASTTMGTPSIHAAETGSLMRPGSPIGSARGIGAASAIPGMSLDPEDDDNKSQIQTSGGDDRSIGGWLSRVVGRGRADSSGSGQGRYAPLGQQEEGNRNN
jgi:hypothetical protein